MIRAFKKLNSRSVDEITKQGRHSDGLNLYLAVKPTGRYWVFLYRFNKRQREISLGPVHTISLSMARERAARLRIKLLDGIDPLAERESARTAIRRRLTFAEVAEQCIDSKERGWKHPRQGRAWRAGLANHCQALLNLPVDQIGKGDIRAVVEPLWAAKPHIAGAVIAHVRTILDFAAAHDYRSGLNPAAWGGHLREVLSAPKKPKHFGAMAYTDVPAFIKSLRDEQSIFADILEFIVLTGVRKSEALGARWDEIDFEKKIWTVPLSRMKTNRPHVVPLSTRAIEILNARAEIRTGEFVFGKGTSPPSVGGLTYLFYRVRPNRFVTIHGFRSALREWLSAVGECPREIAEDILSHSRGTVEAAYHRAQMTERARPYLQGWADYLEGQGA